MAGDHYIPQLILRGFASRGSGEATMVFQFRRGRPGHELNTAKVAKMRDFYGQGPESVDEIFRDCESSQADLVRELCHSGVEPRHKGAIDVFVTQLAGRSRHLRLAVSELGGQYLDSLEPVQATQEGRKLLVQLMLKTTADDPSFARLPGLVSRRNQAGMLEKALRTGQGSAVLSQLRASTPFEDMARSAHIRAFANAPQQPRVGLSSLTWRVESVSEPLILGDPGPLVARNN